jgi:mannose/fructose/N-acetylgalactosamine-specific phosphotransferase system component IID
MKPEQLIPQIETYSNAIVGFVVLQALAYAYSFGSSEFFNCLVKTSSYLAAGLSLLFLLVMALLMLAIQFCRKALRKVAGEFSDEVEKIYLGKMIAVVVFSLIPLSLTLGYAGMVDWPKVECNKIIAGAYQS